MFSLLLLFGFQVAMLRFKFLPYMLVMRLCHYMFQEFVFPSSGECLILITRRVGKTNRNKTKSRDRALTKCTRAVRTASIKA